MRAHTLKAIAITLFVSASMTGNAAVSFKGGIGDVYPNIKRVTSINLLAENTATDGVSHIARVVVDATDSTASSTAPAQRHNVFTLSSDTGLVFVVLNRATHERHDIFSNLARATLTLSNQDLGLLSGFLDTVMNNADLMVIIASRGAVAQGLSSYNSGAILTQLKSLGAPDAIDQLTSASAFVFVGYKGLGSGNGVFITNNSGSSITSSGPAMGRTLLLDRDLVGMHSILTPTVRAANFSAGSISTAKFADDAVTADKIGTGAVTSTKLSAGAVTSAKILNDNVTRNEINDLSVSADKIATGAISAGKFATGAVTPIKVDGPTLVYHRLFSPCDLATGTVATIPGTVTVSGTICPNQAAISKGSVTGGVAAVRNANVNNYDVTFAANGADRGLALTAALMPASTLSASDSYIFQVTLDHNMLRTAGAGDNDPAFGLYDTDTFLGCGLNGESTPSTIIFADMASFGTTSSNGDYIYPTTSISNGNLLTRSNFFNGANVVQTAGTPSVITCTFWFSPAASPVGSVDEFYTAAAGMHKYYFQRNRTPTNSADRFDVTNAISLRLYSDTTSETYNIHSFEVSIWRL